MFFDLHLESFDFPLLTVNSADELIPVRVAICVSWSRANFADSLHRGKHGFGNENHLRYLYLTLVDSGRRRELLVMSIRVFLVLERVEDTIFDLELNRPSLSRPRFRRNMMT